MNKPYIQLKKEKKCNIDKWNNRIKKNRNKPVLKK